MRSTNMTFASRICAGTVPRLFRPRHNEPRRPPRARTPGSANEHVAAMKHTFLFEPGTWTGTGTFWTEDGHPTPAEGRTVITHRSDCWLLAGSLRVLSSPHVEF